MTTDGSPFGRDAAFDASQAFLEQALEDVGQGKRIAASQIYRSEHRRMCRVAKLIVRNQESAEDIVHDAFAQIIRDAKDFDPNRGSARSWIYTIVRNTALRSKKRASREIATSDETLVLMADDRDATTDPQTVRSDAETIKSCLESMPPLRRATIVMSLIDGETHAAIADSLGVPIGTVKSWIRRELVSLREKLK